MWVWKLQKSYWAPETTQNNEFCIFGHVYARSQKFLAANQRVTSLGVILTIIKFCIVLNDPSIKENKSEVQAIQVAKLNCVFVLRKSFETTLSHLHGD